MKNISKEDRFNKMKNRMVRHFKGLTSDREMMLYRVIGLSHHTETGEALVVYEALYGDYKLYTRPYDMFLEEVPSDKENPTGQKYRFELI